MGCSFSGKGERVPDEEEDVVGDSMVTEEGAEKEGGGELVEEEIV